MTKKDYIAIAGVLKDERDRITRDFSGQDENMVNTFTHATIELDIITGKIANVLQSDNSRFDREKFLKACGYTKGESHV